jgi:hypothetical protein
VLFESLIGVHDLLNLFKSRGLNTDDINVIAAVRCAAVKFTMLSLCGAQSNLEKFDHAYAVFNRHRKNPTLCRCVEKSGWKEKLFAAFTAFAAGD